MGNINNFYATLKTAAIRLPHHFRVGLNIDANENPDPVFSDASKDGLFSFFARGATLPAQTLSQAEVPYQGLNFRIPTAMTFGPGTVSMTVLCDSGMKMHKALLKWKSTFANPIYGGGGKKSIPSSKMYVDLLNQNLDYTTAASPDISASYVLEGVFPTNIGELTFTQAPGEPITFTFEVAYQYWYDKAETDPIGTGGTPATA